MTTSPTLRVNGSMLEVIQDGRVLTRYSLVANDYHVRINDSAVELTANGQVLDRYPLEARPAPSENHGQMTRIPVSETEPTDQSRIMYY